MSSILGDWHSPFAMLGVMQVLLLEPNSGVFRLCEKVIYQAVKDRPLYRGNKI